MADPMTPERRAEIRQRVDGATAGPWEAEEHTLYVVAPGHVHVADFEWLADTDEEWQEFERNAAFVAHARQDVPDLLDEVDRLHIKVAKDHDELRDKRSDLLNVRGILSPNGQDRRVPMPLGAEVAPAIEWLVNDRDQLRTERDEARAETKAAAVRWAEHADKQSEKIRKAETELAAERATLERLREEAQMQGRLRRAEHRDVQTQRTRAERAEAQVERLRALCEGGPGPHNERQIWIADVLTIIGAPAGTEAGR